MSNKMAILVPRLPSEAKRKEVIEREGFSIMLYLKNDVPYVKIHFPNDSSGLHDIVLKVKGASSLEEALRAALEEIKLSEVLS